MGKVIKFPTHKDYLNKEPVRPELSAKEAIKIKENLFIDQLTEEFALDFIHVLQENAVDTKKDVFLKDLAIVVEAMKGLLKRDFDDNHPMQIISDSIAKIHTLKDGRKVTDINYGNIIIRKKKESKKEQEERQEELDVEFDPDMNLD